MKRILAIDGGGLRGLFALQVLRRLETLFREREGDQSLVLADVMDFIAGTSTGAIIATCLSWGMEVQKVEELYLKEGTRMFTRSPWYRRIRSKYRSDGMASLFKEIFSEPDGTPALLGTDMLRTRLMVVMRNATTGSPWPISNNPDARYNDRASAECNLDIPMWQLLRASTAAPTFFTPERISIGDQTFCFVDGGVSPYNNASLLAYLMATLPPYRMNWEIGVDKIHMISVGTGRIQSRLNKVKQKDPGLLQFLGFVPAALMESISAEQDLLCRVLGKCIHGHPIDSEVGDLCGENSNPLAQKQFTYVRYDRHLDMKDDETLIPPLLKARLDDLKLMPELKRVGQMYAEHDVKPEHLDAASIAR